MSGLKETALGGGIGTIAAATDMTVGEPSRDGVDGFLRHGGELGAAFTMERDPYRQPDRLSAPRWLDAQCDDQQIETPGNHRAFPVRSDGVFP